MQLPTLICDVGPTCSYPHISTALAGLKHSGERRSIRKVCLARITRTIAIGLNTLQRLYNCTRPNRTETGHHRFQALPYGWSPSKWIVPSCIFESGAAPTVKLVSPARGPSKLWNPSPASPRQSLLRRKAVSRHDHTDPPTGGVLSTRVSPRTLAHNKAGGLYGNSPNKHG
jgi:hypothetical protein